MRTPRLPSLADIPHRVRERIERLPEDWRAWRERLQENPAALWESPIVRWGGLAVLLLLGAWAVTWFVAGLAPGGGQFAERTPWATLYVACTNPECRATFSTQQALDFDEWPLTCKRCGEPTVYRASRCPKCQAWFATAPGEQPVCPHCAARRLREEAVAPEVRPRPTGDDAEDPW